MAFCAAIATAVVLGACGSGMPGNAVVQIGKASITTGRARPLARGRQRLDAGRRPARRRRRCRCRRTTRRASPRREGAGNTSPAGRRPRPRATRRCASELPDARHRGARLPDPRRCGSRARPTTATSTSPSAQIDAAVPAGAQDARPRRSRPPRELRNFLAASGQTIADLKWRTMVEPARQQDRAAGAEAGREGHLRGRSPRTTRRTAPQYTTPETRDLHLVLVHDSRRPRQKVQLAAGGGDELRDGRAEVLDRRRRRKANGGAMVGVTRERAERAAERRGVRGQASAC